ncbi:MAG TPA: hypothetical protein VFK05_07115 [Polyangiaceae bacterium]|nr:hypothetical protein [Polyangiaceae bacterium]
MAKAWWAFQECGWPSWLCLLLTLLGFALAVAVFGAALLRARTSVLLGWMALGFALSPLAAGALGQESGRAKVDGVLSAPSIDATQRERIRLEGYREAQSCVAVGGALSTPPLLLAAAALVTAYALRRKAV